MTLSSVKNSVKQWILLTLFLTVYTVGHSNTLLSEGDGGSALTASKVFAEIPLEVLDMIRPSIRLDMLDYYTQADSIIAAQDALGGQSSIEQMTPDYLKVSVTPVSTLEIKLLPCKKDQIIMTLYTVSPDSIAADTEVRFFDSQLKPLPTEKFLKSPTLKDFFNLKNSDLKVSDLMEKIPFESISYTTGPGDIPLTATFTTLETLSQEDRDLLTPLLIPSLKANWQSSFKFK